MDKDAKINELGSDLQAWKDSVADLKDEVIDLTIQRDLYQQQMDAGAQQTRFMTN